MELVGLNDREGDEDGLDIDMDDVVSQEMEATAYRFVQIVPDRCIDAAKEAAHSGINHPVVFLCDVADHFGLAIARKVSPPSTIDTALKETANEFRPGVISCLDLELIEGREPTIEDAIRGRMTGLIGYFPIVVAANGGFTVFPWPYSLKEKSKLKLFP